MGEPHSLPAYGSDTKITERSSLVYTCQEVSTKHTGRENGVYRKVSHHPSSPRKGMVQTAQPGTSQTDPWVAQDTKAVPSLPSISDREALERWSSCPQPGLHPPDMHGV